MKIVNKYILGSILGLFVILTICINIRLKQHIDDTKSISFVNVTTVEKNRSPVSITAPVIDNIVNQPRLVPASIAAPVVAPTPTAPKPVSATVVASFIDTVVAKKPSGAAYHAEGNTQFIVPEGFEDIDDSREINIYFFKKIIAYAKVSGVGKDRFMTLNDGALVMQNKKYDCSALPSITKLLPCNIPSSLKNTFLAQISISNNEDEAEYASLIPLLGYESLFYELYGIDAEQLNETQKSVKPQYIPQSTINHLSGRIGYSTSLTHRITEGETYGSTNINALFGYGNFAFETNPYINISSNGKTTLNIDSFVGSYVNQGMLIQSGVKSSNRVNNVRRAKNILPIGNVAGVWIGSFDETRTDKKSGAMKPLEVYLPTAGKIEVFKGKQSLFIGSYQAGSIIIPVDSFPIGNYDVIIKRSPNSMAELPLIEHRIVNSIDEDYFTFSFGSAQYDDNSVEGQGTNFYDMNYDSAYVAIEGATRVASGVNLRGSTSWMDDIFYGSLGVNVTHFSFAEFDVDAIYASNDSWSAGLFSQTNLNDLVNGMSVSLSASYADEQSDTSANLSFNLNYRLNGPWFDSLRLAYYQSRYSNFNNHVDLNKSTFEYNQYLAQTGGLDPVNQELDDFYPIKSNSHDFSLNLDKYTSWYGMPVYLTANIGKDNLNDFRIGLGVNLDFGKTSSHYNVSARYENIEGKNSTNIYVETNGFDADFIDSAQAGFQAHDDGYGVDVQTNIKTPWINSTLMLDSQYNNTTGDTHSQASMWFSGGVVFDTSHYSFTKDQNLRSGYVFDIENNDHDLEIYGSSSFSGRGFLIDDNSYVLSLNAYSKNDVYMSALGAVLPENESFYSDVFYPGNFKFVTITPRRTIEVAGMYQPLTSKLQEVLIKNHESEVLIKNHESEITLDNNMLNEPTFFQLTVSKQHPTIEIFENGIYLCTKNIESELNLANLNGKHFIYLTQVSCPS